MTLRSVLIAALAIAGLSAGTSFAQGSPQVPFRLGVAAEISQPCAAVATDAAEGLKALVVHLAARLQREVQVCPTLPADAGLRVAQAEVDIAHVDPATFAPHKALIRPVLTGRSSDNLGRLEVVASALAASQRTGVTGLAGARIGYAGRARFEYELPKSVLVSAGADAAAMDAGSVLDGPEGALEALRANRIDVMVLNSAAHQRICRVQKAGEVRCADLKVLRRTRPQAQEAWAMRLDTPRDQRLRLIGVLVGLHLENPAAFKWMAPNARELEPTEATALDPLVP